MKGSRIVVESLFGQQKEGIISGTPKPGTHMQIKTAVEPVNGRPTFEIFAPSTGGSPSLGGDGAPGPVLVLDIDDYQGKTFADAYVTATRCKVWAPAMGDELNIRKQDIAGTSSATEALAIGDRLLVIQNTGLVSKVAVGLVASPVAYPWQSLETLAGPGGATTSGQVAEWLILCMYTGQ